VTQLLRASGFEIESSDAAMDGLKRLALAPPDVLFIELAMEPHDGRWMIKRIREDYVGKPPRIIAIAANDVSSASVDGLGVDAVLLKPLVEDMLHAAVAGVRAPERGLASDVLRELGRMSLLSADIDAGLRFLARQLTRIFRTSDCLVKVTIGEAKWVATAKGSVEASQEFEKLGELASAAGAPVLIGSGPKRPAPSSPSRSIPSREHSSAPSSWWTIDIDSSPKASSPGSAI